MQSCQQMKKEKIEHKHEKTETAPEVQNRSWRPAQFFIEAVQLISLYHTLLHEEEYRGTQAKVQEQDQFRHVILHHSSLHKATCLLNVYHNWKSIQYGQDSSPTTA